MNLLKQTKDFIFTKKEASKYAYFTVIAFAIIHSTYLAFFLLTGVKFMAIFNVFSILFYFYSITLLKRNKLSVYVIHVYLEVLLHYGAALFCLGFGYGFELVVLAFITVIFETSYLAVTIEKKYLHPVLFCALFMLEFLFFVIWFSFKDPFYSISLDYAATIKTVVLIVHACICFILGSFFLLMFYSQARGLEQKIYQVSITDNLTKVSNRFGIEEQFNLINDEDKKNYIVSIFDIDNFKRVNDTYGHKFGDIVLTQIAEFFNESLPSNNFFSRWGGEEFVILTKVRKSLDEELKILDRLREKVSKTEVGDSKTKIFISLTIGSKTYNKYESLIQWVEAADANLYTGKTSGKNVHIYN